MGFGGHVMDMIQRMKNNKALSDRRKSRKKMVRDAFLKSPRKRGEKVHWKKVSPTELSKIRKRIQDEAIQERTKYWVFTGLITFILCGLILYLVFG
jgi:hypothetical protein